MDVCSPLPLATPRKELVEGPHPEYAALWLWGRYGIIPPNLRFKTSIVKIAAVVLFIIVAAFVAGCGGGGERISSTSPGLVRGNLPTATPFPSPPEPIYVDGSPPPSGSGTPRPSGSGQTTYTVASGDSLSAIAQRFGVDLTDLARVNNITNPSNISVGQVLTIPAAGSPQPSSTGQATPTPTPTRTPTPAPTPTPSGQAGACTNPYIVQSGDYPGLIAQKCGVDVNALIQLNNIDPSNLQVGQQLRLP